MDRRRQRPPRPLPPEPRRSAARAAPPPPGARVLVVAGREAGTRLDLFLVAALDISRKHAKRLVDGHKVAVGGRIEGLASRELRGGERVQVDLALEAPAQPPVELPILYEDGDCLAVAKPPGIPSGPTRDAGRVHAARLAEGQAGRSLVLLHRLDKDTSGVLLLAKTRGFATALLEDFKHRRVEKTYLALVRGRPRSAFEVVSHLKEVPGDRVATVRAGGLRAETAFLTLASSGAYALVEAHPRTGRMHQLRVQLAEAGHPILGDALYGGDAAVGGVLVPRQLLHAAALTFPHPGLGRTHRVEAPLPEDFRRIARAALGPALPPPLALE